MDETTKRELLEGTQGDLHWFSDEMKPERERWVLDRWLECRNLTPKTIVRGDRAPDFVVDGVGVEIAEVLQEERRRGDEYKCVHESACKGEITFLNEPTKESSLQYTRKHGHEWVADLIHKKSHKYFSAAKNWTLVIYFNVFWADRINWREVEILLSNSPPVFMSIDVIFGGDRTFQLRKGVWNAKELSNRE